MRCYASQHFEGDQAQYEILSGNSYGPLYMDLVKNGAEVVRHQVLGPLLILYLSGISEAGRYFILTSCFLNGFHSSLSRARFLEMRSKRNEEEAYIIFNDAAGKRDIPAFRCLLE